MKKNDIMQDILVEKLVFGGQGFSRLKSDNPDLDGRVVFITGGVVPGSTVSVRVLKKRKDFFETQLVDVIKTSPIEKMHPNNPYGECGGCKRVNIPYEEQLKIKQNQIVESMFHLSKLKPYIGEEMPLLPIKPSKIVDGYRNKVEFSFGKNISQKEHKNEQFNVGFHKQGEFSKIQDVDGFILCDEITNKIYKQIKDFCKTTPLPVYDTYNNTGFFRHILIRKTHFTNEAMIIFGFNPDYIMDKKVLSETKEMLKSFFVELAKKEEIIKSVYFSVNNRKADVAIGELELVCGEKTIKENINGLTFNISPTSFFQTNSTGAEDLYQTVLDFAHKDNLENFTVLDLYAGTGTIGMIFAQTAKKVYSVELETSASKDGEANAKLNNISNMEFVNAKVEDFLKDYINNPSQPSLTSNGRSSKGKADLLIIDPPRAGMHPDALPNIIKFGTKQIIYVSCNPATLSRDLAYIVQNSDYKIEKVQPKDMFPHTHHIETIVSLVRV